VAAVHAGRAFPDFAALDPGYMLGAGPPVCLNHPKRIGATI
jgi:hypothetical protein